MPTCSLNSPRSLALRAAVLVVLATSAGAQVRLDWTATHATPTNDQVLSVASDASGRVFAAGIANASSIGQNGTAFISAYDPTAGALYWTATYDSPLGGTEYPTEIATDGTGAV
jgi:hypothetical protein